jgi:hypothetical protein
MPDAWEMRWFGSLVREGSADWDGDGLTDLSEYGCGSSPVSADTDADGIPDGTEVLQGTNPASSDTDGDGVSDPAEVLAGTSATNGDSDGDGIGDGDEIRLGLNPLAANDDADGVPTAVEVAWDGSSGYNPYHRITNPTGTDMSATAADTDGDGVLDLEEIAAGSSPVNGSVSNKVIITGIFANGANMDVTWNVYGNPPRVPITFHVEITTDLVNWTAAPGGVYVSDGINNVTVTFSYPTQPGVTTLQQHRLRVGIE